MRRYMRKDFFAGKLLRIHLPSFNTFSYVSNLHQSRIGILWLECQIDDCAGHSFLQYEIPTFINTMSKVQQKWKQKTSKNSCCCSPFYYKSMLCVTLFFHQPCLYNTSFIPVQCFRQRLSLCQYKLSISGICTCGICTDYYYAYDTILPRLFKYTFRVCIAICTPIILSKKHV